MRRTFYLAASLLFLGGSAFAQSGSQGVPKRPIDSPNKGELQQSARPMQHEHGASRAACDGDTVLYEDWANGFAGNNGLGISWDTTGTYQSWRECSSPCTSNGPYTDVGPLQSTTNSNGYINLDVQADAGYIYGPGQAPPGYQSGPAPLYHMTMGNAIDLSGYDAPVLSLQTRFYHCCAIDHQILVEVSTDGGASWPYSFDLSANYERNQAPPNPAEFTFHLSDAIAANPSAVMVRFTWPDTGPDANGQVSGVYNWYIDDVVIKEANRNDLAVENTTYKVDSAEFMAANGNPLEYTMIPKCSMNCLLFGGEICNIGSNSLNNVQLQSTIYDASSGNQVYQETSSSFSLDSIQCIGGEVLGYRPPYPDTVWADPCFSTMDTGAYLAEYRAITGDTTDCDTTDNFGQLEEFRVTNSTYAVDEYEANQTVTRVQVSPESGGSFESFTAYNAYEFTWFDNTDTIKSISVYIDDTTQAGAGPVQVGISNNVARNTVHGRSAAYYIQASDLGSWVTLPIVEDGNGNALPNGLPVPDMDDSLKTAYFYYQGGSERVGIGASGNNPGLGSWIEGNFGGGGAALYRTSDIHMLRVNMKREDLIERTACDSFTVPSGDETYYSSGMYKDTLAGVADCGPEFTVDLTINNSTTANIQTAACSSYTVPSGDETYTSSGTYMDTIPNMAGCDSVMTIDLTIGSVDTTVNQPSTTQLEANVSGASYQWLECTGGGYSPVSGATSQTFSPSQFGSYAVEVTEGSCVDTSGCHMVTVGLEESKGSIISELYPNPTEGSFTLELGAADQDVNMRITDLQGRVVKARDHIDARRVRFELDRPEGIYMVHLRSGQKTEVVKLVKE